MTTLDNENYAKLCSKFIVKNVIIKRLNKSILLIMTTAKNTSQCQKQRLTTKIMPNYAQKFTLRICLKMA